MSVLSAPCGLRCTLVALFGCGLQPFARSAQDAPEEIPEEPARDGWNWQVEQSVLFDDNVFRLAKKTLDRWQEDQPGDAVSGRFDDMRSEDDFVLTTELQLRRSFKDADGDHFKIAPGLRALAYTQNPKRSHAEFFLAMSQEFGAGRVLDLDLEYTKDAFARNYLADAVDLVGSVDAAERRYEDGVYDDGWAVASYRHRLWKRSRHSAKFWHLTGLRRFEAELGFGVGRRWYQVPFSNRDRDGLRASLDLAAEIGKRWTFSIGYEFELRTDNGLEVLIRDENDFDLDFNQDGDRVDANVRTLQRVDRSRDQHELRARLDWALAKAWTASVRGALDVQDYLSDEPVDDTHRDRVDRLRSARLTLDWEFRKDWQLSAFAGASSESSNRDAAPDADDEDVDYRRQFVGSSLRVRF